MTQEHIQRWSDAGGSAERLRLYAALTEVGPVVTEEGRILAARWPGDPTVGTLGDLVGGPATIRAGEAWLRQRGVRRVLAPMEVATWFTYRVNLGPHDLPPFLLEPTAPPAPWFEAGYAPTAFYNSIRIPVADMLDYGAGRDPDGVVLEDLEDFDRTIDLVHEVSHAAFVGATAFTPLPRDALAAAYRPWLGRIDSRFVIQARRATDGAALGFLFLVPDLLDPDGEQVLAKTLAVHPRAQGMGVGSLLLRTGYQRAAAAGFRFMIHALMAEDAVSQAMSRRGEVIRRYALLERDL